MKEGEIKEGKVWFYKPKLIFKRFFGGNFLYKCIECGKGHDGYVMYLQDNGFTNVADFCSSKCALNYIQKHGYSFRQRITNKKDICIVCGKEHNNQFINSKEGKITRNFCSKKCLKEAKSKLLPKIKNEYKKGFSSFVDLFKEGKTREDIVKEETQYFMSLNVDLKQLLR